jgi:hypothetical protein
MYDRESESDEGDRSAKRQRTSEGEEPRIVYVNQGKNEKERQRIWNKIVREDPDMIVGQIRKGSPPEVYRFYADMYEYQIDRRKLYMHEDNASRGFATSKEAAKITTDSRLHQLEGNWCGTGKPSINLLTNSSRCAGRIKQKGADKSLCRGMVVKETKEQIKEDNELEINMIAAAMEDWEDGEYGDYREVVKAVIDAEYFQDHVNGGQLKADRVKKAREEEIKYFKKMHVYDKVDQSVCKEAGLKPIKVRWVDTCKSDGTCRSRLVAKEFKTSIKLELFSATPPTESLKMILSLVASAQGGHRQSWGVTEKSGNKFNRGDGHDDSIWLLHSDIARAYFSAEASRSRTRTTRMAARTGARDCVSRCMARETLRPTGRRATAKC